MRKQTIGKRHWLIPDAFLPALSSGALESHESTCVLNVGARSADITLCAYFEDRDPLDGFRAVCPARRTVHIRLNALRNPRGEAIPVGVPFALEVRSSMPVVVQHTRLDSSQPALALMTTMAFAAGSR